MRANRLFNVSVASLLACLAGWLCWSMASRELVAHRLRAERESQNAASARDIAARVAHAKSRPTLESRSTLQREPDGSMSSQGPTVCIDFVDLADGVNDSWTGSTGGPGAASASTSGMATGNSNTARFTMGSNSFTIPQDPSGVLIQIKWNQAGGTTTDALVRLTAGGAAIGSNKAGGSLLPTVASFTNYGADGDLWGATITAAQANHPSFGVDIVVNEANIGDAANVLEVDFTVYWLLDLSFATGSDTSSIVIFQRRRAHFQPPPIESIDPHALTLSNAPELIHPENLVPMYVPPRPRPHSRTYLSPIAGAYDPTMLTLVNSPEPIHPENYPMEFVQRAPDRVRQAWQQHMETDGDPTVYLLPAEPEPIHPENYPSMVGLPYPQPQRQAWQFPIMSSTDYTSLLSGEAAHPETTRQAGQDLPRRDWPRQYQPPMERIDPAALSAREQPSPAILPGMSLPVSRQRQVHQPAMEATSYVWATPGDPALYPDRMTMQTPQRAFIRERRPLAGESVVLDAWSGQQYFVQPMWAPTPAGWRVQPPHIQAGQTPPQNFQESQLIAWAVPLSQPVLPLAKGRTPLMQAELAGETVQLALAIPSDWQPNIPDVLNARPRARVAAGEAVVLQQTAATVPQGWESPAPQAGRLAQHQEPAIESRPDGILTTPHDRALIESMGLPVRQLPRPETSPTLEGAETTPQVVPASYAFLDYDPGLSQPVKQRLRTLKLPVESAALDTITLSLPMSEHPPLSLPVRSVAQPQRQSHPAPPYSDATNAADNSVGFMGIEQPRPVHRKPLAPSSESPLVVTPAGLQKEFTIEPMFAGTRTVGRPQQSPIEIIVDRQYNAVPLPSEYQADWIVPQPRPRIQPVPIESISATVYLVGANPAAFAGSGAIVVAGGAVYSAINVAAGKVTRASKGI